MIIRITDVGKDDGWYNYKHDMIGSIFRYEPDSFSREGHLSGYLYYIDTPLPYYTSIEITDKENIFVINIQFEEIDKKEFPEYYL